MTDGRTGGRADGRSVYDRREFLAAGLGLLLTARPAATVRESFRDRLTALQQAQDTSPAPSGRLYDPTWAGPSVQPVTSRDNDKAIQAIEKRIKCTCGCGLDVYTCRTTDFTCPVSPKMHAQVLALVDAGSSPDQILAEFVREHGVDVLMAPKLPWVNASVAVVIVAAAGLLLLAMRRWVRRGATTATPAVAGAGATPAELERLQEALQQTEA